ncbi:MULTISPECIES: aldehyde dehydrogenase family protein [unclassified Streptomyces]|uniref:aldehyde dehydrogenase family protein n=1 Tax=unclassified Streptomyces TaxID=2593676 RepID=UPI000DAB85AB|nr:MULTISPECIES: aldehyde dehydrogenase family protein [unclassified Streptomyces]PZT74840.1 aldehyde dehydrogenase [Streptomyces sp. AC1-42T]PZT82176.1 aldehyde dehydrogenase [Streptomyces sp. AC1-42W]
MPAPIELDALGPNGTFRARNRITISDVAGDPVAELGLVPRLFVSRTMKALHRARSLPVAERLTALTRAARIFAEDVIGGLSFAEYEHTVARVSGVPLSVVRAATAAIIDSAEQAEHVTDVPRPRGAVADWRDPRTEQGSAVWTRRGNVFAVHAAGNHPGPHSLWLEALALGYRVAVRPSRREPFTPHRLISALRLAGFGTDQVVLLPTDHDAADEVLRGADFGLVYGGDEVVRKYAGSNILPQGPGRSKILVTADTDWREHLDTIVDSISHQGGVACINATTVLVDGDPAPLAAAIAERLRDIVSLPPEDEKARLAVQPVAGARALEEYLLAQARGCVAHLGGDGIVEELPTGGAVLRPAVHQLDRPDARQASIELPFPCVWVAPWKPADGIGPMHNTLVLTAYTDDETLIDSLLQEPTISNVYLGDHPTYWIRPGVPHDGYLGEFLMRTKTVIRG